MKKPTIITISILAILVIIFVLAASSGPSIKPVCCANEDGFCIDQGIPMNKPRCGDYELWTFVSDTKFCDLIEECTLGLCLIRGKDFSEIPVWISDIYLCGVPTES